MITALARDFAYLAGCEVIVPRDRRLSPIKWPERVCLVDVGSAEEEWSLIAQHARETDWTIVIAPEFDEFLLKRVRHVERSGGKLLSPNSTTVSAAQNKQLTASQLAFFGIATPRGGKFRSGFPLPRKLRYPAIIKPLCGAGSAGIQFVESPHAVVDLPAGERFRIEEFCPGIPVSVSVLCGPNGHYVLPPGQQRISDDGSFRYLGGCVPLTAGLRHRAESLAHSVTRAAVLSTGYIGIDMVLAEKARRDCAVVIEVNPRLTTSYVGLRELARCNLAQAMIDVAEGRTPDLSFDESPVEFLADGTILRD